MNNLTRNTIVLVTGATGYIASRCVLDLLEQGYQVRGTVRNLNKADELKKWLAPHTENLDQLTVVEADLGRDEGWDEAMRGCKYVLHLASPFPLVTPENEDDLIRPAVEGTQRVLSAAARNGVQRVVQTSSVAAISAGHQDQNRTFSADDWSNLDGEISAYPKSKTLAEKAAWEYVENLPEGQSLELAVVNPGYVLGPVINDRQPTSVVLHKTLLEGSVPGIARIKFNVVDVRDVSKVHQAAMITPEAAGKRFVCVSDGIWLPEFVNILAGHFNPLGYRVPRLVLPGWFLQIYALFDEKVRETASGVGKDPSFDNRATRKVLNWLPIPLEQTIIEMGESMIHYGVVEQPGKG
jgi:nucleoside-diphosphate-sugar epimerase